MLPAPLAEVVAWVATYLVHSTLLGVGALAVAAVVRTARARELVWRAALVGGVVTTTLQATLPIGTLGGRWVLPGAQAPASAASEPASEAPPTVVPDEPSLAPAEPLALPQAVWQVQDDVAVDAGGWAGLALGAWLFLALGSLAWTAVAVATWRQRLAGRRPVDEHDPAGAATLATLADLRARGRLRRAVALTQSDALEAPVALGVLRPEICIPPRALELEPGERRAMLAHELGHLARLDPLWLGLSRAIATVFFFQPLHRVARRRLAECAEFLCDDWALRHTDDRVGLASCLAEVAGWLVAEEAVLPAQACAMADRRSALGRRVERILDDEREPEDERRGSRLAGGAALCACALVAPRFATTAEAVAPPGLPTATASAGPAEAASGATTSLRRSPAPGLSELRAADAALSEELAALEGALHELQELARGRTLPQRIAAQLAALNERIAGLRAKQDRMRRLVSLWSERAPAGGGEH